MNHSIKFTSNWIVYSGLSFIIILNLFCTGCGKDCHTIETLYDTYYEAVVYPENFNEYVQNNRDQFNDDFFYCLDEKRNWAQKKIEEGYKICDETFVQGDDFWHQCYDDVDQEYGGYLGVLNAINQVTRNNVPFEQTEGALLILSKQTIGFEEYESLMSQTIMASKKTHFCERCERKLF